MKPTIRTIKLIPTKTIQINNYETIELNVGDSLGYKALELLINISTLKKSPYIWELTNQWKMKKRLNNKSMSLRKRTWIWITQKEKLQRVDITWGNGP